MATNRTRSKGKSSGVLARRKAALERAALRMAEQRRAAEEAEAERQRKEAAFDELVADFELAVEDEKAVAAEVEEEVRRVRERGQVRIDEARVAAARVVLAMGDDGETVAGCARRLGVGQDRVKELRRLGREALDGQGPDVVTAGKAKASTSQKTPVTEKGTVSEKTAAAGGPGGEQREGVRAPGSAGTAPVAAPPVTAPAAAPASAAAPVSSARAVPPVPGSGGPSAASGPVSGARPGWPESSR
ncbi:hypothetical protein ACIRQF_31430 [Streptomyces sp. NPDC101191]|uniref:hypothetical protein n=1 Tax=Streptomyces sp. NPDC101191 TaxID=3366126 RepID=UPI00382A52D1